MQVFEHHALRRALVREDRYRHLIEEPDDDCRDPALSARVFDREWEIDPR